MTNFSNFEKLALDAFGSENQEETILCLMAVSHLVNYGEDREQLLQLTDKLIMPPLLHDYTSAYQKNAREMKAAKEQFIDKYRKATGDKETRYPWHEYLMVLLMDVFGSERILEENYRMNMIFAYAKNEEVKQAAWDTTDKLMNFSMGDDEAARHCEFLQFNRDIAATARDQLKRGIPAFNEFICSIPKTRVRPYWIVQGERK